MNKPTIASRKGFYQELEIGKTYFWCSCGLSKTQPYCDGSHKGAAFEPVKFTAVEDTREVILCGCKHTGTPPFCDGSHNNLPGGYREEDPEGEDNREIPVVSKSEAGDRRDLDGGCYVFDPAQANYERQGTLSWCRIISPDQGARYQSLFHFQVAPGLSPIAAFGVRDVVLFISGGCCRVTLSGHTIEAKVECGIYLRPGEAFQIENQGDGPVSVFVSACPMAGAPEWLSNMPDNFDAAYPERMVLVDVDQRRAMASRYFQILVSKEQGSATVTQFIGHIPLSKAERHRHLYEEALLIRSGQGFMWTETGKAPVKAGDVIFLPAKQEHSLQCTAAEGMDVVGVIYPGDNPGVNY